MIAKVHKTETVLQKSILKEEINEIDDGFKLSATTTHNWPWSAGLIISVFLIFIISLYTPQNIWAATCGDGICNELNSDCPLDCGEWAWTDTIPMGPYLQPTTNMKNSMAIAWRTSSPAAGTIHYGINDVNEHGITSQSQNTKHHVLLQGLEQGKTYKYKLVSNGVETPVFEFKTSPDNGKCKLLVGSDWHFGGNGQSDRFPFAYPDMLSFDPDIVIITGDLVNYGDNISHYEQFFSGLRELLATSVLHPVPGNHEFNYDDEMALYRDFFYLPENGPADKTELLYSVDYGGIHLVSHMTGNEEWLNQDLQAAPGSGKHIIVGQHFPTYLDITSDRELGLSGWKADFTKLMDQYGVDINFYGHRHNHQRTYPILCNPYDDGQWGIITTSEKSAYNANTLGTIYHMNRSFWYQKGPGFPDLHFASTSLPEDDKYLGYVEVTVDDLILDVKSYRFPAYPNINNYEKVMEDHYTIDKSNYDQAPTPVIEKVRTTHRGAYTASIEWDTSVPAKGRVIFGTDAGNLQYTDYRDDQRQVYTTRHSTRLQALVPGTLYYYRVVAKRDGEERVGEINSFTTAVAAIPGETVAHFDFGPIMFPPSGARASIDPFNNSTGNGWTLFDVGSWVSAGAYSYKAAENPSDAFCFWGNDRTAALWQAVIPNGTYQVEIVMAYGGWFWGEDKFEGQCLAMEDGQYTFKESTPSDPYDEQLKWVTNVDIADGILDVNVGCGDSGKEKYSIISSIKITVPSEGPTECCHKPTQLRIFK